MKKYISIFAAILMCVCVFSMVASSARADDKVRGEKGKGDVSQNCENYEDECPFTG